MIVDTGSQAVVTLFITSDDASSERRFDKATSIKLFKQRLEPITGCPSATMKLNLYQDSKFICEMSDDEKML